MLHPERESLYCSTHMGVMPPTSVLAGNKTVCTVGMSGKQSKCLCMSHGENIPHHQVWTSPLALLIRWARAMLFVRGLNEPAFACSLYPAACLRDHSPPLPLFHPERKNLQQVYQFKCCPHTLPQHQKTMSCCIKPNMSFFQGCHPTWVSFQTIRVQCYIGISWHTLLRVLTFEPWDFFWGKLLRRVKNAAVNSRVRAFSRTLWI